MKKRIVLLILSILLVSVGMTAFAAEQTVQVEFSGIHIVVDGATICPKDANGALVMPFIYNGSTYLPVRSVANALGLGVEWDNGTVALTSGQEKTAAIGRPLSGHCSRHILLAGTDIRVTMDGSPVSLKDANGNAVTPIIVDGTTYLPVRAIADALQVPVLWDGDDQTVYLGKAIQWKQSREQVLRYGETIIDNITQYDAMGHVLFERNSAGTTTYTYDGDHRLTQSKHEANGLITNGYTNMYTYDNAGNQVEIRTVYVGGATHITTYTYDSAGRVLTNSTTGTGWSQREENRYDDTGDPVYTEFVYTSGDETEIYRTVFDKQTLQTVGTIQTISADGSESLTRETCTYDREGTIMTSVTETTVNGNTETDTSVYQYTRDSSGVLRKTVCETVYGNGNTARDEWLYDQWGNQTSYQRDYNGETTVMELYDAMGETIRSFRPDEDPDWNVDTTTKLTYNDGMNIVRREETFQDGQTTISTYTYDAYGNLIHSDIGNGWLVTNYTYTAIER